MNVDSSALVPAGRIGLGGGKPMGIFRINRRLLDRLVLRSDRTIDPSDAAAVRACLVMMRAERKKSDEPSIPYSDHHCRVAYGFAYFGIHVGIVEHVLQNAPGVLSFCQHQITKGGNLNVCAFGGGPGPETLALARLIDAHPTMHNANLDVTVVDRENHWNDPFRALIQEIREAQRTKYGTSPSARAVTIDRAFMSFDMLKPEEFRKSRSTFQDLHLIVVNYVISEICSSEKLRRLADVLTTIGSMSQVGTRLLIVDRLLDKPKVDTVMQMVDYWNITSSVELKGFTLDPGEEKDELRPYMTAFNWLPNLTRDFVAISAQKMFA